MCRNSRSKSPELEVLGWSWIQDGTEISVENELCRDRLGHDGIQVVLRDPWIASFRIPKPGINFAGASVLMWLPWAAVSRCTRFGFAFSVKVSVNNYPLESSQET